MKIMALIMALIMKKTVSNKEYFIVSIINKDNTRGKEVNRCNIPKKMDRREK